LDLGDRYSYYCVLDAEGEVLEEGRLASTPKAVEQYFSSREPARVSLEVGTHSPWISRLVERCGHEVFVANASKLRLISTSDSKSDQADAETLARIARLDPVLLAPIHHRGVACQVDLARVRSRDMLVRARTSLIQHVRGMVKALGGRIPHRSAQCFHKQAEETIPEELLPAVRPVLEALATLTDRIKHLDKEIVQVGQERYPETALLQQVGGVGPLTSLSFVLTVEDPHRFKSSRAVGSYFGLRPRQRDSGSLQPQLRITKAGDSHVRRLLVNCAHYILGPFGPDTDLRRWGLALAERGGKNAKKRAVVAVARKLAVLLHRLWITGEVYEPLRNSNRKEAMRPAKAC